VEMKTLDPIGNPEQSNWILIQPVDDHDEGMLGNEIRHIKEICSDSFALFPVKVDWFTDLTPWPASAAFKGQPDFGDNASDTLQSILDSIVSRWTGKKIILGGYSLAGFFALWAGYQTDVFDGIVAASPSVWYPGWDEYIVDRRMKSKAVYLSLGDREERTRNVVMRTVGDRIREQYRVLQSRGTRCKLDWNEGNHFKDPEIRIAAGFAWVINTERAAPMRLAAAATTALSATPLRRNKA